MKTLVEELYKGLRLRIARTLNRPWPNACWFDLVIWALFWEEFPARDSAVTRGCVAEGAKGSCYCGQLLDDPSLMRKAISYLENGNG